MVCRTAALISSLVFFAATAPIGTSAYAHSTGHESRTVAACQRLSTPARQNCVSCVTRPAKSHYHPDYPSGAACRPDNGKP